MTPEWKPNISESHGSFFGLNYPANPLHRLLPPVMDANSANESGLITISSESTSDLGFVSEPGMQLDDARSPMVCPVYSKGKENLLMQYTCT